MDINILITNRTRVCIEDPQTIEGLRTMAQIIMRHATALRTLPNSVAEGEYGSVYRLHRALEMARYISEYVPEQG